MNGRQHDPLDHSIRSALHDIVSESPTPGELPVRSLELRRTAEPVRSRRPMLVAAAAIIAVAGVAGTVAVANRSSGPSNLGTADTIEQSDTSVPTVAPTTSTTSTTGLDETSTARLLYPIAAEMDVSGAVSAASVNARVTGTDSTWIAHSTAFVTPEGHVVSAQEQSRALDPVPAELPTRTVGDNVFHLSNEEGNRVYFATGTCRAVAVLPGSETSKSEPWSNDALTLMATVDLTSPDRWVTAPKGWTEIEGGFAELIYDVSFAANKRGLTGTKAHLRQAFAPLGLLIGASVGMVRAEQVTMKGLPEGTSDQAWVLVNSDGLTYLGWNTTFGSALLFLEGDDPFAGGEFPGVVLEAGHGELWNAGLTATAQAAAQSSTETTIPRGSGDVTTSYPESVQIDTTVQITEQSTTSYPEGVTPTTSQIAVSTTPASCSTPENG